MPVLNSWEYPKGSGIQIVERPNRAGGKAFGVSYRVRIPASATGTRKREDYERKTLAAAETLAGDQLPALMKQGTSFAELPVEDLEAGNCRVGIGIGFIEAAIRNLRTEGRERTVLQVVELKHSKKQRVETDELRERRRDDFGSRATKIADAFGPRPISAVSVEELTVGLRRIGETGITDGPLTSRSVKNFGEILSEVFTYGARKRHCILGLLPISTGFNGSPATI